MKIYLLLIIAFILNGSVHAQDKATFHLTFNHLALSVKDVNRAAEFYKSVLKLQEITNRTQMDGIRWFSMEEGKELHLISTVEEEVTMNKAVHLALTTPDFDAFVKKLDQLKIMYSDWPGTEHKINIRADGIKQIFFQDPDGYWIEVNSVSEK